MTINFISFACFSDIMTTMETPVQPNKPIERIKPITEAKKDPSNLNKDIPRASRRKIPASQSSTLKKS